MRVVSRWDCVCRVGTYNHHHHLHQHREVFFFKTIAPEAHSLSYKSSGTHVCRIILWSATKAYINKNHYNCLILNTALKITFKILLPIRISHVPGDMFQAIFHLSTAQNCVKSFLTTMVSHNINASISF